MVDRIARTRIRSVRLKSGGATIRVLPSDDFDYAGDARQQIDTCLKAQGNDIAGFALVVWGKDGDSTCQARANPRSTIPTILIPDFVRNRLLAERIINWAVEQMERNVT